MVCDFMRRSHGGGSGVIRPGGRHPRYAVCGSILSMFLDRYLAGEYVAVWDDLVALGPRVRHSRYRADAMAVAAKTMRRARHNVQLLLRRLDAMEYRFLTPTVYEENYRHAASRRESILNQTALRSKICDGTWETAVAFRNSKEPLVAVQEVASAANNWRLNSSTRQWAAGPLTGRAGRPLTGQQSRPPVPLTSWRKRLEDRCRWRCGRGMSKSAAFPCWGGTVP